MPSDRIGSLRHRHGPPILSTRPILFVGIRRIVISLFAAALFTPVVVDLLILEHAMTFALSRLSAMYCMRRSLGLIRVRFRVHG